MDPARIAELLEPFFKAADERLDETDLKDISTYIDLLLRWNARINLTAIRDPEEIVRRHFGESFFAARHLFPERSQSKASPVSASQESMRPFTMADVGSGAGFPGIPIKLWAREISPTLIESNQKKAVFLREVCRALRLADASVEGVRVEQTAIGAFNLVTMRAVERFADVLPAVGKLVAAGGKLGLLISSTQVATAQGKLPGFRWDKAAPIPLSESRVLLVGTTEST